MRPQRGWAEQLRGYICLIGVIFVAPVAVVNVLAESQLQFFMVWCVVTGREA